MLTSKFVVLAVGSCMLTTAAAPPPSSTTTNDADRSIDMPILPLHTHMALHVLDLRHRPLYDS